MSQEINFFNFWLHLKFPMTMVIRGRKMVVVTEWQAKVLLPPSLATVKVANNHYGTSQYLKTVVLEKCPWFDQLIGMEKY